MRSISTENEKTCELFEALKLLSPGTYLREGIDYIIQSKTGGLIVLGDTPEILDLTEGGFRINCPYTPTNLYELSKMDGAIILSEDIKRIVRANVTLRTSPTIPSNETGLRHRTADKFARESEHSVLAVSRSRNTLTLYLKDQHYIFRERPTLLSGANQTMLVLTQHLKALQNAVAILNWSELSGNVTLADVVSAIQLCERVRRAEQELDRYRIELGTQAQSLQYVIPELTTEIESGLLIIKDYYHESLRDASEAFEAISGLDTHSLADQSNISEALGYSRDVRNTFEVLEPRGYRMLSRVPRIPFSIIENIVHKFKTLDQVNTAAVSELQVVDGVGKARASTIKNALAHMKSTSVQPEALVLSVFDA
ncbi:DNA integrity scanning diadenylate cyclase DisA [Candidatus Poribacteria bacterium]|nr:DNA integrity scanning diadenylate cyclase DisA [Candidatus Poribacteria bacterium]